MKHHKNQLTNVPALDRTTQEMINLLYSESINRLVYRMIEKRLKQDMSISQACRDIIDGGKIVGETAESLRQRYYTYLNSVGEVL